MIWPLDYWYTYTTGTRVGGSCEFCYPIKAAVAVYVPSRSSIVYPACEDHLLAQPWKHERWRW
jgi:hypothetical protein